MKNTTAVEFYRTELSALVSMKECKFQNENEIFDQAKQMEKEQCDHKINMAIEEFERLKSKAKMLHDVLFLDGVLAVLDSIKNETYKEK